MADGLDEKIGALRSHLKNLGGAAVAFSGGADSAFLLAAAHGVLGEKALAVTVVSCFVPEREAREAAEFCRDRAIRHIVLEHDPLSVEEIRLNPKNRCYFCKKAVFSGLKRVAAENGIAHVLEGTNLDDTGDFRPGLAAVAELGVESPLKELGFTKREIREASRRLGLPTGDKPASACLASRFAYGEPLTGERLSMVERAEEFVRSRGFSQLRVRVHRNLARIEVLPEDQERLFRLRAEIDAELRRIGFDFVSMDLGGFKSGSMNIQGAEG